MRRSRIAKVTTVLLGLTLLSGCLWAPELDRVRRDIEKQIPGAHFNKEIAFSLGPVTLGLARLIVGVIPDAKEARPYLKHVRNVKVAVYEAQNIPSDLSVALPADLKKLIEKKDWELAVKTRDKSDATWILYKSDGKKVEGLYVVTLSDDELVLVRASGNLDRLFEHTMRENMNLSRLDTDTGR
jgi:hypothetical protein